MPILGIIAAQNVKNFLNPPASATFALLMTSSERVALSTNGVTWDSPTSGPQLPAGSQWRSVAYGGSVFAAVAYGSTVAASSTDGITWTQRTLPTSTNWAAVA